MAARGLRPLGQALGTEAFGVDLSKPLDDETFAWIEDAFAEHPVLVFRDQDLGPGELAAFGRRFGKPKIHSLVDYRHGDFPEVSWLTNIDKDGNIDWFGVKRATDWHTDSPYEELAPRLAILHAKEVPSEKGGTMFADMRAAYDALDPAMKHQLSKLVGLHGRHDGPAGVRLYEGDPEQTLVDDRAWSFQTTRGDPTRDNRTADTVRQSAAHARVCRDGEGESVAAHRGVGRAFNAGPVRLLPPLAGRRSAHVGRTGDDAPRRRRLPPRRAPDHAAYHRLSESVTN